MLLHGSAFSQKETALDDNNIHVGGRLDDRFETSLEEERHHGRRRLSQHQVEERPPNRVRRQQGN